VSLDLNTAHHLEGLRAIYGQRLPVLPEVELHQISLAADGSTISLTFDLPYFPEPPPRKWATRGRDTVTVGLDLLGVESFSLRGWPAEDSTVAIDVTTESGILAVHLSNPAVSGTINGGLLSVRGFSAYRKNR
jgi:hypothetical protein